MNNAPLVVQHTPKVGRFAPSPTGPLHFGSLVAALGSYLDAITSGGAWLLRIEDVDQPRTVPGMVEQHIAALEAYGFEWDGPVVRQSQRRAIYQAALDTLISAGFAYPCTCTRSRIAAAPGVRQGLDGLVYPGHCARWQPGMAVPSSASWRFRAPDALIRLDDRIRGPVAQNLMSDVGDFPVLRADGCFTYQLAVVVDDLAQGVTDVVRGSDLIDSTPRQMALIRSLGGSVPTYAHLPVVTNAVGEKLSKQTHARAVSFNSRAVRVDTLWRALAFLGQCPAPDLRNDDLGNLWAWAKAHWSTAKIPRTSDSGLA